MGLTSGAILRMLKDLQLCTDAYLNTAAWRYFVV
jgi:hypothetical protein